MEDVSKQELDEQINAFFDEHPDIKPCPFCGSGRDTIFVHYRTSKQPPYNPYYFIKCGVCNASSGISSNAEVVYTKWQTRR